MASVKSIYIDSYNKDRLLNNVDSCNVIHMRVYFHSPTAKNLFLNNLSQDMRNLVDVFEESEKEVDTFTGNNYVHIFTNDHAIAEDFLYYINKSEEFDESSKQSLSTTLRLTVPSESKSTISSEQINQHSQIIAKLENAHKEPRFKTKYGTF